MDQPSRSRDPDRLTHILISISLGTLAVTPFFGGWFSRTRLPMEKKFLWFEYYYYPFQFTYVDIIAALVIGALVAVAGYALAIPQGPLRRSRRVAMGGLMVLVVVLNLNMIRQDIFPIFSRETLVEHPVVSGLFAVAALVMAVRFRAVVEGALRIALIVLSPLSLVVVANAVAGIVMLLPDGGNPFVYQRALAPMNPGGGARKPRVVWIIFDELDQRLTFEKRPAGVDLGAFERFRRVAFTASDAHAPAIWTELSVPSLTVGRKVETDVLLPGEEIALTFEGTPGEVSWREAGTVFHAASRDRANIAILGHGRNGGPPYCRIFHAVAARCWDHGRRWTGEARHVIGGMARVARQIVLYFPFLRRAYDATNWTYHPNRFAETHERFRRAVEKTLADPNFDFIYVHWFIPHTPYYYDRNTDRFAPATRFGFTPKDGYLHNLQLANKTLAQMRGALERSGLWDETTVIISADHSCREGFCDALEYLGIKEDKRVPFLVKLPHQSRTALYGGRLETVGTARLIEAIRRGEKVSPHDIPAIMGAAR